MALFILQPGCQPLGDFDVLDTDQANILGGEIMVLDEASMVNTATEMAAADVFDGYIADQIDINIPTRTRVVARIGDTAIELRKLFYLADDGTANYGTLFGQIVGAPVGLSTGGAQLGPNTMSGSGKVTLWDKPGLYAVTTNRLAADVVPMVWGTNQYDTPLPGAVLSRSTAGLLTRALGTGDRIACFIELTGSPSLVTTPGHLVGAAQVFDRIVIQYLGCSHNVAGV